MNNEKFTTENRNLKIINNNLEKINEELLLDKSKFMKSVLIEMENKDFEQIKPDVIKYIKESIRKHEENNELFTLWINEDSKLPELQQLSLKSMILTGHKVTLYCYDELESVPDGIEVSDANKILDKSEIFRYNEGFNKGSYSGFANLFRIKCMYELGKSWFDCDILVIKNINDIQYNGPIIASQYDPDGSINPNNAFLRLNKGDDLLKESLNYFKNINKNEIKHGETGPRLFKSLMDEKYRGYYDYMVKPSFIASINFFNYKDILKPSETIIPNLKMNEIWGFHIWNAMFREYGKIHETQNSGFYYDLKKAISTSSLPEEYNHKIRNLTKKTHKFPNSTSKI